MTDILIIGGGPAGLTAAVYACRAGKSVLVLEKETAGGQITFSPRVENIPGFTSLSGNEFAEKLVEQALAQGAEIEFGEALDIIDHGTHKEVITEDGSYKATAVILAAGAKHRLLGLPREEDFIGNGISFCAVCDGAFYEGQTVGIVGGGNTALQEAVLLSDIVGHLYVFQDLPVLTGEQKLQAELFEKKNVTILTGVRVKEFLGGEEFKGVRIAKADGTEESYELAGLFVAIGLVPQNEAFASVVGLDDRGYADSGEDCMTKTPGIFVAGDCRRKRIRQVTTAAADGAVAALQAVNYVEGRG